MKPELHSGDFNFGKWRSKEQVHHRTMLSQTFHEAATSPGGRNAHEFPAIAEFFRVLMARENIESYPLIQVCCVGKWAISRDSIFRRRKLFGRTLENKTTRYIFRGLLAV